MLQWSDIKKKSKRSKLQRTIVSNSITTSFNIFIFFSSQRYLKFQNPKTFYQLLYNFRNSNKDYKTKAMYLIIYALKFKEFKLDLDLE